MTLLEAVQLVAGGGVGTGALAGGLGYLVRQAGTALAKRAEARRLDAEREAKLAEARRLEAHADDVTADTVRSFMAEMRERVQRAEDRAARAENGLAACRAEHVASQAASETVIAGLRARVEELEALVFDGKSRSIVEAAADRAPIAGEDVRRSSGDER